MWIMIRKEIPIAKEVRPRKLDIFWAEWWRGEKGENDNDGIILRKYCKEVLGENLELTKKEKKKRYRDLAIWKEMQDVISRGDFTIPHIKYEDSVPINNAYGAALGFRDHNWAGAVKIKYKGEDIRLFPDEYSLISDKELKMYMRESHTLMENEIPEGEIIGADFEISPEKKSLVEAAILEGAKESEAKLLALGLMTLDPESEIKPYGYYHCRDEYYNIFSRQEE